VEKPLGFVALQSIKRGRPDPEAAIAQIRQIYFKTTKRTIEHDISHAIELLKSLPDEETRDRAAVYMDGLSQMRSDWAAPQRTARGKGPGGASARSKSTKQSKRR